MSKPKSFEEIDLELEEAIERLRDRVRRLTRGRVIAVVERVGAVTVCYRVDVDPMTEGDVERLMQEKPRPRRRK